MRKIPLKLRKELEELPRMKRCECHSWSIYEGCEGKIEWHHVFIYAGKQINEKWAIVAACKKHHDLVKSSSLIKEFFEIRSLLYADEKSLKKYPRKNWSQLKKYLGIHDV